MNNELKQEFIEVPLDLQLRNNYFGNRHFGTMQEYKKLILPTISDISFISVNMLNTQKAVTSTSVSTITAFATFRLCDKYSE